MPTTDPAALAAAFSPAVVKALASSDIGQAAGRVAQLLEPGQFPSTTLGDAFEMAHNRLLSDYQNEYTYASQIISKIVCGRHSPSTASAILEQPMGSSKADVLILNGTSTIYEIKTDLDSFTRLQTQLDDYKRRAEYVYVVVSERRMQTAHRHIPEGVGILALRRRGSFTTVRKAASNLPEIRHRDLFQMLRTREAVSLTEKMTGERLPVPTGYLRDAAYEYFRALPIQQAHTAAASELKKRGLSARQLLASSRFPNSLRALAYATELSTVGAGRLEARLSRSVADVLSELYPSN